MGGRLGRAMAYSGGTGGPANGMAPDNGCAGGSAGSWAATEDWPCKAQPCITEVYWGVAAHYSRLPGAGLTGWLCT